MDDHETELLDAVRTALREAGFDPGSEGGEGVHLVRRARGVMVGWMPAEIDELHARTSGLHPPDEAAGTELAGLHHATGLALAAALRGAGFTTQTQDDHILVLPPPPA
ncbi:hypothetical protein ADK52_05825 [Streptomyces sp. WM6372]|uniref:hypothetical protein n=1 Tax=Streptomyces sp. WM6372 TaxID=1415555 RepID=UPI0006AFA37F|nr:hypothetical protein [Streptomyces sp. WM6372]KOU29328.1 hypothetical protein ADK52_05825 [Streptomyces sp. WM6372]